MMVDTTIYGVVGDGGVYHVDCVDLYEAHDDYGRLYYLDDQDPHGLSCDECGRYIFDPVDRHQYRPTDRPGDTCDECYAECGEGAECELHYQPGEPEWDPDYCTIDYQPIDDHDPEQLAECALAVMSAAEAPSAPLGL
jgi:hypothetical protein